MGNLPSTPDEWHEPHVLQYIMEHTDFDGLLVTGTPSCLTNILGWVQVSIGDNLPTNSRFRDMLLLSAVPYQIWIDQEYKIPIIEALSDKRNTPLVSSINSHQILKNPIRVLGKDLINLLNELEVDEIQVYGFGTKSPITTGIELGLGLGLDRTSQQ